MLQTKSKENFLVILALTVLLAVTFYDVVFQGKTFKVSTEVAQALPSGVYGQEHNIPPFLQTFGVDSAVYEEPVYEFIKHSLRQGVFPLWNPHQALGYPLVAMLQSGMFFPLTFILYIFPSVFAWDILILARFFLAGFFMYLFMRRLRFSYPAAAVAGIAFMLSGPLLLIQNVTANVDILIPFLLLSLECLIQRPDNRRSVFTAVVVALLVLAGQPEHVFLDNAFGLGFAVFRIFSLRKQVHVPRVFYHLLAAYVLALGLSAFALVPFLWNFKTQFWHGHPEGMGFIAEEVKGRLISIIMPHFFQKAAMNQQWVPLGWLGGYLGIIPLGLAFISLFNRQKKGLNYFFVIAAVFFVGKSYGWPAVNWIGHLPVLNMIRYAYHTPPLAAFCIAVSAGMGIRTVINGKKVFMKGSLFAGLAAGAIVFTLLKYRTAEFFPGAQKAAVFAGLFLLLYLVILLARDFKIFPTAFIGILFLALLWMELFCYIYRVKPARFETFPPVPYIDYLKKEQEREGRFRTYGIFWTFFPNTATAYGVDDLGIFDGLLMRPFVDFVNHLVRPNNFVADLRPTTLRTVPLLGVKEFLDLLNVRYLVFPKEQLAQRIHIENDGLKWVYDREVDIYQREGATPRTFIVHQAIFYPAEIPSYAILYENRHRLQEFVLINERPEASIRRQLALVPLADHSSTEIIKYRPNEVVVQVNMENSGFLVLTDMFHPDWQAYVDGGLTKVHQADYLFRAVFLPAGQHTVRFVFRPMSFYVGCVVSLAALLFCLALISINQRSFKCTPFSG